MFGEMLIMLEAFFLLFPEKYVIIRDENLWLVQPFPNKWTILLVCFPTCIVVFDQRTARYASLRRLAGSKNIRRKKSGYLETDALVFAKTQGRVYVGF